MVAGDDDAPAGLAAAAARGVDRAGDGDRAAFAEQGHDAVVLVDRARLDDAGRC